MSASLSSTSRAVTTLVKAGRRGIHGSGLGVGHPTRPLSPHITIYTFKENMIASVVFRGTGIAMTLGLGGYAILYPFLGKPWKQQVAALQQWPLLNALVKFGVAFPFAYHFAGGLRHIAWDNILFHNPVSARISGYAALGFGAVAGLAGAVYESRED